jgi:CheY-like chemotaxis protein
MDQFTLMVDADESEFGSLSGGLRIDAATAPKMLIADDDPSIVRLLAERCSRMGFTVVTAANGVQALVKASRSSPDILVIDVNMPEVDGLSVCAHLLDPDRKPLNVIVMTGGRSSETMERCEGFGAFYAHKGARFWSDLGAALTDIFPEMAAGIRQVVTHSIGVVVPKRARVLLIDDDSSVREILSSRLEKCGVQMLYAASAIEGFKKACREEPSVIVADYFMPNGDAQYLLTKLRTAPATENIPVIVLSGRDLTEVERQVLNREICGRPGPVAILRKSFDTSELFAAVQKFCGFEVTQVAGRL